MAAEMQLPKFLAVDFYCGAGGTTRGLVDAGGYVVAGVDKDVDCRETYLSNNINGTLDKVAPQFLAFDMFPASDEYPQGQQHDVWDKLRALIPTYKAMVPGAPLVFAICAPCQSFTKFIQRHMSDGRTVGRERDLDLLSQTVGFIEEFKPDIVISENVANIRRGKYKYVWNGFQSELRDLGYATGEDSVCASKFGVPQFRRRSILIGIRSEQPASLVGSLSIPKSSEEDGRPHSVRGAIGHLPSLQAGEASGEFPNHVCRNLSETNRQRLESVKPGEPNFGFSSSEFGDLSLPCHRKLEAKGIRGFGDVYTRMRPDRPSPTITTRFLSVSNGRFGHYDEGQVRALSLREGAALQSFDDDYEFYGNMDTVAKMIGNAVPPKLSKYMAEWTYELWKEYSGSSDFTSEMTGDAA